jgi:predicted house-cleaning noncanonical NTP pyrophosphatase (MazG superfamily)
MRVVYNKLVRDQIPGIIARDGYQAVTRVLDHAGYRAALRAKLLEEAQEAQAAAEEQLLSELADVLEVLQALASAHGARWEDIESEAARERAERGGFDQRIFVEYVEQPEEAVHALDSDEAVLGYVRHAAQADP